jgi:hypothetical protein
MGVFMYKIHTPPCNLPDIAYFCKKNTTIMIKIPYGQSDFRGLIENGNFYQDRTVFIEQLEKWDSNYPVFLRPRRFGKSLFISTLHHYYGLEHKNNFQNLFDNLYIGQHPTLEANSYMVLRFDFSRIDTATFYLMPLKERLILWLLIKRFFQKNKTVWFVAKQVLKRS